MKKEEFAALLTEIDEDLLLREEKAVKNKKRTPLSLLVAAACLCLTAGVALALWVADPGEDGRSLPPEDSSAEGTESHVSLPAEEFVMYTAAELAGKMATLEGGATNFYTTVYLPDTSYLDVLQTMPEEVSIYRYPGVEGAPRDRAAFDALSSRFAQKAEAILGIPADAYRFSEYLDSESSESSYYRREVRWETAGDLVEAFFEQAPLRYRYEIWNFGGVESLYAPLTVGGETLILDPWQSDEEILEALAGTKELLLDLFGVSFSRVEVVRQFSAQEETAITSLDVYFYDDAYGEEIPIIRRGVQRIVLHFQKCEENDTFLGATRITCRFLREGVEEIYKTVARVDALSLEEAEEMLFKGYVFGGHSCPVCMESQEKVDFEDYDCVELAYEKIFDDTYDTYELYPFYAFYKRIGTAENGLEIYARALVPAFHLEGVEEYFASRVEVHS